MKFNYYLAFISFFFLVSVGCIGQVRPDQFPIEENPDDTNFEVYSQKNGVNTKATISSLKYGINPRIIPIVYVPATAGNSENQGTFVKDPNSDVWYIDHLGMAVALGSGGSDDTNTQVEDIRVVGANLVYDIVNKITGSTLDTETIPLVNIGLQGVTTGQGLDVETVNGIADIQVIIDPDVSNVLTKSNQGLKVELPPAQADTDWVFNPQDNVLHNSITDNAKVGINKSDPFYNLDIIGNLGIRTGDGGLHFRSPSNNGAYSNFLLSSLGLRIENSNELWLTDQTADPSFKIDFPNSKITMYDDAQFNKKILDSQGNSNDGTKILSSDNDGNALWVDALPTVPNIYTEDGTIEEDRNIQLDGKALRFKNGVQTMINIYPPSNNMWLRSGLSTSSTLTISGEFGSFYCPLAGSGLYLYPIGDNTTSYSIDVPNVGLLNQVGNTPEFRGFVVDELERVYVKPDGFKDVISDGAVLQKINIKGEVLYTPYRFPFADGLSGQSFTTDGSGNLSWSNTVFFDLNGNAGINTTTPQATLDVVNETSGVLVPRLTAEKYALWTAGFNTTTDVTGIGGAGNEDTSRQGEMVYSLNDQSVVVAIWNGTAWVFDQLN